MSFAEVERTSAIASGDSTIQFGSPSLPKDVSSTPSKVHSTCTDAQLQGEQRVQPYSSYGLEDTSEPLVAHQHARASNYPSAPPSYADDAGAGRPDAVVVPKLANYVTSDAIDLTSPIYRPINAQSPTPPNDPPFSAKARKAKARSHAGVNRNDDSPMPNTQLDMSDLFSEVVPKPLEGDNRSHCGNPKCSRTRLCHKCRRHRVRVPKVQRQRKQHFPSANQDISGRTTAHGQESRGAFEPHERGSLLSSNTIEQTQQRGDSAGQPVDQGPGTHRQSNRGGNSRELRSNLRPIHEVPRPSSKHHCRQEEEVGDDDASGSNVCNGACLLGAGVMCEQCTENTYTARDNRHTFGPSLRRMPRFWNVGKLPSVFDTNVDYNPDIGALADHTSDRNHSTLLSSSRMERDGVSYQYGDGLSDYYCSELLNYLMTIKPQTVSVPTGTTKRKVMIDYLHKETERYYRAQKLWPGQIGGDGRVVTVSPSLRNRRLNTIRLVADSGDNDYILAERAPNDRWQGKGRFRSLLKWVRSKFHRGENLNNEAPQGQAAHQNNFPVLIDQLQNSHAQRVEASVSFLTRARAHLHLAIQRAGNTVSTEFARARDALAPATSRRLSLSPLLSQSQSTSLESVPVMSLSHSGTD